MTINIDFPLTQKKTESSAYQHSITSADSIFSESKNILASSYTVIRALACDSAVSFCLTLADMTRLSVLSDLQVQRFV